MDRYRHPNHYGSALQAAAKTESTIATFERALFVDLKAWPLKSTGDRADGLIGSQSRDTFSKGNSDGDALGVELPEHALAHKNLGLSLLLVGKYEAGIRHYA